MGGGKGHSPGKQEIFKISLEYCKGNALRVLFGGKAKFYS